MRKSFIKHENMKWVMNEIQSLGKDVSDDTFDKFLNELKHSCLIVAGNVNGDEINVITVKTDKGDFGMLFTDMDEFRKVFPNFEVEAHHNPFETYLSMLKRSNLEGYILNFEGEGMILPRFISNLIGDVPDYSFSTENSYTSTELKQLKDSIDNSSLEEFIKNPENLGKYEELFERISSSTMLTLMLSEDDLESKAENGVIPTMESVPVGFLYIDHIGGDYATVYTSEERISKVHTPFYKYSQLVNFSHMVNFVLNDDMDGIIINPGKENVVLTRDVLLEFSSHIAMTCNDSRLNSAIGYMFLIKERSYVEPRNEDYRDESHYRYEDECWCDEYVPEYDPFDSLDDNCYQY